MLECGEVWFPPEPRLDIDIDLKTLPLRYGRSAVKLQLNSRIVLDSLQGRHLLLAVDIDDRPIRLIDAEEEINHALAERVLEVIIVVPAHGCDQLWNRVHEGFLVLL